jgi:hypothetical protein
MSVRPGRYRHHKGNEYTLAVERRHKPSRSRIPDHA